MNKIAYIVSARLGLEAFVYTEIEELRRRGCNIVVFTTKYKKGPYMPQEHWTVYKVNKILVILNQLKYLFRKRLLYLKLFKEAVEYGSILEFLIGMYFAEKIEKEQIKHIHCHMGDRKLFVGFFIKGILDIPLTATIHAHELYGANPNSELFNKAIISCDKILTISEYNKKLLVEKFKVPPKKIGVIRLFAGKEKVKKVLGIKNILTVSHWTPKKGHKFLLKAISELNRNDFKLWIVGGKVPIGKRSVNVRKIIHGLNLKNNVVILGRVPDELLQALYLACDIFCLPSITEYDEKGEITDAEGVPEVIKEAMAFGKPVISTNHAGIPELVDRIIVEEDDVEGLKKALNLLLDNGELRKELGLVNQEKIDRMYPNTDFQKLIEIFSH